MVRVSLKGRLPVLDRTSMVAQMIKILPQQKLRICIFRLELDYSSQEFSGAFSLVFLFGGEGEKVEGAHIIGLQSRSGGEFLVRVAVFSAFIMKATQVVVGRRKLRIKSRTLGELVECSGPVKLICQ